MKEKDPKTFIGRNIRKLRHKKRWSQEIVARKLNISIPAFSKIETGITDVNISRLVQIAAIFDISINEICTDAKQANNLKERIVYEANELKELIKTCEKEIKHLQRKVIILYEKLGYEN